MEPNPYQGPAIPAIVLDDKPPSPKPLTYRTVLGWARDAVLIFLICYVGILGITFAACYFTN